MQNLILITLDCVRRETLSCYPEKFKWYQTFSVRAKTPNIDQVARDGALFLHAICQAPFTPASHASILTGLNPYNHGIRGIIGYKLSSSAITLAEELREHGYQTVAFIGSHALSSDYGLDRGFDVYDEKFETKAKNWILGYRRPAWESTDRALAWLDRNKARNFFLFLHYFDAHDEVWAGLNGKRDQQATSELSRLAQIYGRFLSLADKRSGGRIFRIGQLIKSIFRRDVYGRAFQLRRAREIDAQVGRILGFLKAEGLYERTLIVTMSDHGDAFGEHGEFSHREYLYDTTLRIPLIIKGPRDLSGKVIPQLVRSIDVYPTILEMLGLRAEGVDGVSLVRLMVGHHRADLHAYSETRHEVSVNELDKLRSHFVSLRTPRWKLILNRLDGTKQLYDLWKDPAERQNVWSQYKGIANYLEKELLGLLSKEDAQGAIQMSPEEIKITEETLKGLGYL